MKLGRKIARSAQKNIILNIIMAMLALYVIYRFAYIIISIATNNY